MGNYIKIAKKIKRSSQQRLINALVTFIGCIGIALYVGSVYFQGIASKILLLSFIFVIVSVMFLIDYLVLKKKSVDSISKKEIFVYFAVSYLLFFVALVLFGSIIFIF